MAQVTDVLVAEHRIIERVLGALERAAGRLEMGETVEPAFFSELLRFLRDFADGRHHLKEEDALVPALVAAGLPLEEGPLAVILAEHVEGRAWTRRLENAIGRLEAAEPGAAAELVACARAYVALLRDHIMKEDRMLFPMAEHVLSGPARERLGDVLNRSGGACDYASWARELERRASLG